MLRVLIMVALIVVSSVLLLTRRADGIGWVASMYSGCHSKSCVGKFSGNKPYWGTAAADPMVLPPGTVVEIRGLGRFTIEDNCPACAGERKIDIYWPNASRSQMLLWGVRPVELEVVEP